MRELCEKCARISAALVVALAVNAATVCTGLLAGFNMQAFIVCYWAVLTVKHVTDAIRNAAEGHE